MQVVCRCGIEWEVVGRGFSGAEVLVVGDVHVEVISSCSGGGRCFSKAVAVQLVCISTASLTGMYERNFLLRPPQLMISCACLWKEEEALSASRLP